MQILGSGLGLAVFFAIFLVFKWINILNEYERGVIFRLGRVLKEPKARDILYRDVYGWFERVSRGVYGLSPRGEREIALWGE